MKCPDSNRQTKYHRPQTNIAARNTRLPLYFFYSQTLKITILEVMNTMFQTQTGSTDAGATARQAFIDAELAKVGGNMDALVQKYKIVDNIIEDWVEYKAWEGLVDFYMEIINGGYPRDTYLDLIRNAKLISKGLRKLEYEYFQAGGTE